MPNQTALSIGIKGQQPPQTYLDQLPSNALITGAPSADWWAKQAADVQFRFAQSVRAGLALNETSQQISKRVRDGMEVSARNAMALVRTSVQQVAGDARRETFQRNDDVIAGIKHISTLDERTTDICIAYGSDSVTNDGAEWDLDYNPINGTSLPYNGGVPRHWQCRSVEVGLTKPWDQLGYMDLIEEEVAPKELPKFEDWLKAQDAQVQDEMLGAGRAELWREGKIDLRQLLDQQGNPLSVAELEAKYATPTTPYEKARDAATLWVQEAAHQNGNVESARVYRDDGTVVIQKVGDERSVSWTLQEARGWKGATLNHFHPIDKSLSNGDLFVNEQTGLRRTQAISSTGSFFEADYGGQSQAFADSGVTALSAHDEAYRYLNRFVNRDMGLSIDYSGFSTGDYYTPAYHPTATRDVASRAIDLSMQHLANDVAARFGGFAYTAKLSPFADEQLHIAVRELANAMHVANTEQAVVNELARRVLADHQYDNFSNLKLQ